MHSRTQYLKDHESFRLAHQRHVAEADYLEGVAVRFASHMADGYPAVGIDDGIVTAETFRPRSGIRRANRLLRTQTINSDTVVISSKNLADSEI